MKFQLVFLCLVVFAKIASSRPSDGGAKRNSVVNKLQEILAELEGNNEKDVDQREHMEGDELMANIDISDKNLDDFQQNGDEFILDSDKTADLLEEFRQAMNAQGTVNDDEQDEIIPLKSQSMAQPELSDNDEDKDQDNDKTHSKDDIQAEEKMERAEDVDTSDMNLNKLKENEDEVNADTDNTGSLLEKFRQAMHDEEPVGEDEKDESLPLKSRVTIKTKKRGGDETGSLLEKFRQDSLKENEDESNADTDSTGSLLEKFRQAMHDEEPVPVGEDEKDESLSLRSSVTIKTKKRGGDETGNLLEEFRQAMRSQDSVEEGEEDEIIPLKNEVSTAAEQEEKDGMAEQTDDEIDELDLDTMQPMSRKAARISDFKDTSRDYDQHKNPSDFVSELLSDLNGEE